MTPIEFEGVNAKLVAEGCGDLPCCINQEAGTVTTIWELSDDELEDILMSRKIALQVVGNNMPPIGLGVIKPNIKL